MGLGGVNVTIDDADPSPTNDLGLRRTVPVQETSGSGLNRLNEIRDRKKKMAAKARTKTIVVAGSGRKGKGLAPP